MPRLSEQMDRGHGGYLLVAAPALFGLLGFWLDGLLGWTPVLTIVGALYGLIGALYKVLTSYRTEMNTQADARRGARTSPASSQASSATLATVEAGS